ncbi:polysaccharide pyruvyl transferase family protein [Vibrio diabolicus]|nr:polysaccharide pyruvyl transferase family protein [Vibrio diabolicus]
MSTRKYRYMFTGFYGMRNFGDDLFSSISSHGAAKYWNENNVKIIGPKVDNSNVYYSIPNEKMLNIYSSHGFLGKSYRLWNSLSNAINSETVVYSGGSLFSNVSSSVREFVDSYSGAQLFALGVSVGPFINSHDELKVKQKLSKFKYISVRDKTSFDIVNSFELDSKIVQSCDLAGLIPEIYNFHKEDSDFIKVGFSPCNNVNNPEEMRSFCEDFYNSILKLSKFINLEVTLFNLNTHSIIGDQKLNNRLYYRLINSGINCKIISYSSCGIEKTISLINNLDLMVSARLHGAVAAYTLKVPYILYEYHKKCEEFNLFVGNDKGLSLKNNSMYSSISYALNNPTATVLSTEEYCQKSRLNFIEAPINGK